jgi:hypothetical protein
MPLPEMKTRPADRSRYYHASGVRRAHLASCRQAMARLEQPSTRGLAVDGCGGGCCGRKTLNWYSWRPCRSRCDLARGKTDGRPADGQRRRAVARHVTPTPTPTSPVGAERLRGRPPVGCWRGRRSRGRARRPGCCGRGDSETHAGEPREVALSLWRRVLGWCGGDLAASHGDMCRSGRRLPRLDRNRDRASHGAHSPFLLRSPPRPARFPGAIPKLEAEKKYTAASDTDKWCTASGYWWVGGLVCTS